MMVTDLGRLECRPVKANRRSPLIIIGASGVLLCVLYGGCFWILLYRGGWIPLLPPAIAFAIATGGLAVYTDVLTRLATLRQQKPTAANLVANWKALLSQGGLSVFDSKELNRKAP